MTHSSGRGARRLRGRFVRKSAKLQLGEVVASGVEQVELIAELEVKLGLANSDFSCAHHVCWGSQANLLKSKAAESSEK